MSILLYRRPEESLISRMRVTLIEYSLLQPGAELVGTDLELAGELYLQWCHDQPISLFRKDKFLRTLGSRDQGIQLAISALAARFPPGDFKAEKRQEVASAVRSCRKLVTDRITNGKVRLSTLQCLCILSMVGFAGKYPIHVFGAQNVLMLDAKMVIRLRLDLILPRLRISRMPSL
jgi:hypothetical protein